MRLHDEAFSPAMQMALKHLKQGRFLKLILGASFQDADTGATLLAAYLPAHRLSCIDIAADAGILSVLETALAAHPDSSPLVMMSLDLDGDPHFRKATLAADACIDCLACLPSCPVDALEALPAQTPSIHIHTHLCYGCGRCVPTCPTDALVMQQQPQAPEGLLALLFHPLVEALELHTHALEVAALERCFQQLAPVLAGKLISLCFRPLEAEASVVAAYLHRFDALCQEAKVASVLLQLDGKPMSGNTAETSGQAALDALRCYEGWQLPFAWPRTLSGGINHFSPRLAASQGASPAGYGIGSVARHWITASQPSDAQGQAARLLGHFL